MSKRQYTHRSRKEWHSHIDQQAQSGLSVKEYCHKHGLASSNFYAWRKKLAVAPTSTESIHSSWVALEPSRDISAQSLSTPTEISLSLPHGIQLIIRSI